MSYIQTHRSDPRNTWVQKKLVTKKRKDDFRTHREFNHESVDDTAEDGDKVKHVPAVFEVALCDNEVINN